MHPILLGALKNAADYGDSIGVESLNATVPVGIPLSKGRISLRIPLLVEPARIPKNSIKSKIKAMQASALIHVGPLECKGPSRVIAPSPIDARLTGPLPATAAARAISGTASRPKARA
jgi:hypothetical protein